MIQEAPTCRARRRLPDAAPRPPCQAPFDGSNDRERCRAVAAGSPRPVPAYARLTPAAHDFVARLLELEPARRLTAEQARGPARLTRGLLGRRLVSDRVAFPGLARLYPSPRKHAQQHPCGSDVRAVARRDTKTRARARGAAGAPAPVPDPEPARRAQRRAAVVRRPAAHLVRRNRVRRVRGAHALPRGRRLFLVALRAASAGRGRAAAAAAAAKLVRAGPAEPAASRPCLMETTARSEGRVGESARLLICAELPQCSWRQRKL